MNHQVPSFTGRRRARATRWSVKAIDRIAHAVITVGGLGTILAVSTVCIFLVAVVVPLFRSPRASDQAKAPLPRPDGGADRVAPLHVAVDEYNLMAWCVFADGIVRKFRLDTGELLDEVALASERALTAASFPRGDDLAVLGYADGSVRLAEIRFRLSFLDADQAPEELRRLQPGDIITWKKGLAQMTPERQLRHVTLSVELQPPIETGATSAVVLLDHTGSRNEISYAALTADGRVFLQRVRSRRNMLTGAVDVRTTTGELRFDPRPEAPAFLQLTGLGDNLYVIWKDGLLHRFDTRNYTDLRLQETVDLSPAPGVTLSAVGSLIGKTTLLVGDSLGQVTGWFRVRPQDVTENPDLAVSMRRLDPGPDGANRGPAGSVRVADLPARDGLALVPAQRFAGPAEPAPVRTLSSSQRKRMFVAGYENGHLHVFNATVQRRLLDLTLEDGAPVEVAALNPRDDGLLGVGPGSFALWRMAAPHSEATFAAYFRPVWYEGYAEPRHVWQSTGGTDDFESKLGLMPLVFGTVKATLYSMLFAVPLALLAAIFTSEFLSPRLKNRVKPTIEMMASLPSVVLGFLAGLVLAQYAETRVPALCAALITVPLSLVLAAGIWQLLPRKLQLRGQALRLLLMVLMVPVGAWFAGRVGPLVESAFFSVRILDENLARELAGKTRGAELVDGTLVVRDFRTWLSAHRQNPAAPLFESSPVGGWLLLLAPLSLLACGFLAVRFGNPWLLRRGASWSRQRFALADLGKLLAVTAAGLFLAWLLSSLLGLFWDPRGSYIDQYVQRNALIVGFIMGFAVVPIIYTIADDAMSAVPEHLRSASLGAGATRWQTAVRIVVPTAMSGLFSAVMIGFGRAVGETMIVLMAAGNTPIMEWNLFSGFRTLSANIAVEMMEAVEGSTNYRTLFLAAVLLFLMTFAINTVAERVRQRYRRRAYQL